MTDEEKKNQEKAKQIYKEQQEYIEKLITEKKLPELKALTRKQRKELDKSHNNYLKEVFTDKRSPLVVQESCYDWILDNVYKSFNFSDLPNNVCLVFGRMIYDLTYGDKLSEKN
ncbi:hypothetical protein [Pectinatus haikarae]|uniref:hypothetical protein n=1 Tax=Pectinatus haikarae TaxID=349096 RepID=UPI0018C50FA8|nr:hypothetical protein [Pectinatus haikarae]